MLACTFCPVGVGNDSREGAIMPMSLFEKLRPHFSGARFVHLQGWGEPMLSPHIWNMIKAAKAEGSLAGFTTGGMLFNARAVDRLFESGADYVSISIAGAVQATHGALRVRSNIDQIFECIRTISSRKKFGGTAGPRISVSYMMTSANIGELPAALRRAVDAGADDFYATNLDCVFNADAERARIFTWDGKPAADHLAAIDEARAFAAGRDFSFRPYPLSAGEQPVCELDPSRFMFITAQGEVCPCTYLSRPENRRFFNGTAYSYPRMSFGNINTDDLSAVWRGRAYAGFRERFERRREADRRLRAYLEGGSSFGAIGALNPPALHDVCTTCAKAYGV
jgi:MoaA/NifB/PqqE/SkfB family radical SAM enzyme